MTVNRLPDNHKTEHLHTNGYLPRLHWASIIVTTKLDVYLCQWPANTTDDQETIDRLSLPLPPHPASAGDFLTPAHYARLYHLMKSVRAAHQAGRVSIGQYSLYAEYFNAITEIAEAIHGDAELDNAVMEYKPGNTKSTTGNPAAGTTGSARRKTSQMPNLLDVEAEPINEPTAIYPDVITAIYNRQINPTTNQRYGYCVLSGVNFAIIPILDWLNNENGTFNGPIMPYSDPFDYVEVL